MDDFEGEVFIFYVVNDIFGNFLKVVNIFVEVVFILILVLILAVILEVILNNLEIIEEF